MTTTTTAPATTTNWVGINGESTCPKHAPSSLRAELEAHPRRAHHQTDNNDWIAIGSEVAPCETCA